MTQLSFDTVADVAWRAGFRGEGLITALAVQTAENGKHDTATVNTTGNRPPSRDRGLWQINDHFHPEVSDDQAFDAQANANAAYRISGGGTNWHPWSTYNNGAYKQHMPAARVAAANAQARAGGTSGTTPTGVDVTAAPSTAPLLPVILPYGTPTAEQLPIAVDPLTLADLVLLPTAGGNADGLRERITKATLDLTLDQIGQLTVTLADPGWDAFDTGWIMAGMQIDLADLVFTVAAVEIGGGTAGEQTTATGHDAAAEFVHRDRNPGPTGNMSPTVLAADHAPGTTAVVEPSPAVPVDKTVDKNDPRKRLQTSWDQLAGFADDLGYTFNIAAGVLYFARPSFIAATMPGFAVRYRPRHPYELDEPDYPFAPTEPPVCRRVDTNTNDPGDPRAAWTVADPMSAPATVTVKLPPARASKIRPGMRLELYGCSSFDNSYIVTRVNGDIGTADPWTIEAATPVDPVPKTQVPAGAAAGGSTPATTSTPGTGTKQASDFVALCQSMAGHPYVYGAEVSLTDAAPGAFDCSELTQWAAARSGVYLPDGSGPQYAFCKSKGTLISIEEAAVTRGALLFRGPGGSEHVAVSLGDGKSTIEARGKAYGVTNAPVTGRAWTAAARVPDLVYNTAVGARWRGRVA